MLSVGKVTKTVEQMFKSRELKGMVWKPGSLPKFQPEGYRGIFQISVGKELGKGERLGNLIPRVPKGAPDINLQEKRNELAKELKSYRIFYNFVKKNVVKSAYIESLAQKGETILNPEHINTIRFTEQIKNFLSGDASRLKEDLRGFINR
jgi:hypothetical protein